MFLFKAKDFRCKILIRNKGSYQTHPRNLMIKIHYFVVNSIVRANACTISTSFTFHGIYEVHVINV